MKNIIGIGYEGINIDELVLSLKERNVTALVDVRLNAISRKPGFSKKRLEGAVSAAGIKYEHLRVLGNPKDKPGWFLFHQP